MIHRTDGTNEYIETLERYRESWLEWETEAVELLKTFMPEAEALETVCDYVPWLLQRAGAEADFVEHGLDCNSSMISRPWHLAESLHPTNWVVSRSIVFLRRRDPTMPFFCLCRSSLRIHR
jgi:hypothetical protein